MRQDENMSSTPTRKPTMAEAPSSTEASRAEPDSSASGPAPDSALPPTRIRVTGSALSAIREMMEEEDLLEEGGLRITARTGAGCSAPLGYGLIFESEPEPDDRVLEFGGVRLFLDPTSAWMLDGLVVDYVTSSPMGEGFAFRHRKGSCGPSC